MDSEIAGNLETLLIILITLAILYFLVPEVGSEK